MIREDDILTSKRTAVKSVSMDNKEDLYLKPSKANKGRHKKPKPPTLYKKKGSGLRPSSTKAPKVFRCAYGTDIEEDYFLKD